jgi:hypothetical protein
LSTLTPTKDSQALGEASRQTENFKREISSFFPLDKILIFDSESKSIPDLDPKHRNLDFIRDLKNV